MCTTVDSINEFLNGKEFKVDSFLGGVYKNQSTKCILHCNIHGLSSEWGNPQYIKVASLVHKKSGCIKCAKMYKPTTNEMFKELNEVHLLGKNIKVDSFKDGEYKNNNTKCVLRCNIHGLSSEWGNPQYITVASIIYGNAGCRKCSNTYQPTTNEIFKELNEVHLLNKNIKVDSFKDGEYKNFQTKCILKCDIHGLSSEWGNPQYITVNDLKNGIGCAKCGGVYKHSTNEKITELNERKRHAHFSVVGFTTTKYVNERKSLCLIKCEKHGLISETPKISNVKRYYNCIHCIEENNKQKEIEQKTKAKKAKEIKEQRETERKAKAKKAEEIKKQKEIERKAKAKKAEEIKKQKEIERKAKAKKAEEMKEQREIERKAKAKKAKEIKEQKAEQKIKDINNRNNYIEVLNNGLLKGKRVKIHAINNKEDKRCIIECEIHGLSSEWGTPDFPLIKSVISNNINFGCKKCSKKYRASKTDIINSLKNINKNDITFIEINGEYHSKKFSSCKASCKIHGNMWEFDNPYYINVAHFLEGKATCPKCTGHYCETEREALINIKEMYKHNNLQITSINGEYLGKNTRYNVECKYHGKGDFFNKPLFPSLQSLKKGMDCPCCITERKSLQKYISSKQSLSAKDLSVYFVKFKDLKKSQFFYKVGIKKGTISKRFNPSGLKKDNVKIIEHKEINLTNIEALNLEYYILRKFVKFKKPMFHVLKYLGGGSECFSEDVLNGVNLEDILLESDDSFKYAVNELNITKDEKENAILEYNKIVNSRVK